MSVFLGEGTEDVVLEEGGDGGVSVKEKERQEKRDAHQVSGVEDPPLFPFLEREVDEKAAEEREWVVERKGVGPVLTWTKPQL